MRLRWRIAFALALFNDVLDLVGVGSIPIIGDVIDLATSALLWGTLGTRYTLPTALELIPGMDVLPIYTATVSWAYYQREHDVQSGMTDVEVK